MKKQFDNILARIMEDLDKGVVPWRKPWCHSPEGIVSHATGHQYSLLNCMLLDGPGEYLTFNQARKEGGHVKKGAKSRRVFFYKPMQVKEKTEDGEEEGVLRTIPVLQQFNVFHIDDCEGVEAKYIGREGIAVSHEGGRAFYSPANDSVTLPKAGEFIDDPHYYSTLFHELAHSTGAPGRLDRDMNGRFGDSSYAREELVAEITAAFVCGRLGLGTDDTVANSAAYIGHWKKALAKDPGAIVWAASRAEKAAKFIMENNVTQGDAA